MEKNWYEDQDHPIVKLLREHYPNVRNDEPIRVVSSRIWIDSYNTMYVNYECHQKWDAKDKFNRRLTMQLTDDGYFYTNKYPGMNWCTELRSPDRKPNCEVIETPEKIISDNHRRYMSPGVVLDVYRSYAHTRGNFSFVPHGIANEIRKKYIPNSIGIDLEIFLTSKGILHSEVRCYIDKLYLHVEADRKFWEASGGLHSDWRLRDKNKELTPDDNIIMGKCKLSRLKHRGV